MIKRLINLVVGILIATAQLQMAYAVEKVNIGDRIGTQEFVKKTYNTLFGQTETRSIESLAEALKEEKNLFGRDKFDDGLEFIQQMDSVIPKRILLPLTYWRVVKNDAARVATVLEYLMVYRLLALRDIIDEPVLTNQNRQQVTFKKQQAAKMLKYLTQSARATSSNVFSMAYRSGLISQKAQKLAAIKGNRAFYKAVLSEELITADFEKYGLKGVDYSLSALGYIPGNQVKLISQNDTSKSRVDWFNERMMFKGGRLDWTQPYMKMPTRAQIANQAQIEDSQRPHIAFLEDPIFMKIRDMIDEAEESIFIDIFLFGGTMGAVLAKYLIDESIDKCIKTANNKVKFQTVLLHDYSTNYGLKEEMMPIFEYMRDRINGKVINPGEKKVPRGCVRLMQANIHLHTPGVPFGLTNIIENTEETFPFLEARNTYYESKIDHSKVIVIDGNTHQAQAYFGSKNWSDHSGGYYYDDAVWVKGPAANLVQHSYYDDIAAALSEDPEIRRKMYFKEQGFGNDRYLKEKQQILSWMRLKLNEVKPSGSDTIRIAEANVDGKIKDVRNMIIDMIDRAKDHIYMEQLFIYDKYINDALIKKRIQNPELDIRILADHNGNFGMNGLPNTIFMKELSDAGIKIRARRTQDIPVVYPNGEHGEYHQENHRKILSVDGAMLMAGSSNMNPDTFQGSFREFGAQLFSLSEIQRFETEFVQAWSDESQTMELKVRGRQLVIGGKKLPADLSDLLNSIAAQLLRSKDELERRW